MEKIFMGEYEFLNFNLNKATFIFSTAKEGLNFNIKTKEGQENIDKIKEYFNLKEVAYLNQIHSDLVYNYDGIVHQGDGLITIRKNVAVGVFTADCVPILIYDKVKNVIAAVHSGWKGTFLEISVKAITKLKQEYNCKVKDMEVFIGPHIRECCYEVGEELIEKFSNIEKYKGIDMTNGRKLSLEKCVIKQFEEAGIPNENIHTLNICTYCSSEYELHSYRKEKEESGRMFSFVFLRE